MDFDIDSFLNETFKKVEKKEKKTNVEKKINQSKDLKDKDIGIKDITKNSELIDLKQVKKNENVGVIEVRNIF